MRLQPCGGVCAGSGVFLRLGVAKGAHCVDVISPGLVSQHRACQLAGIHLSSSSGHGVKVDLDPMCFPDLGPAKSPFTHEPLGKKHTMPPMLSGTI